MSNETVGMDVLFSAEILNVPENNENTWNVFNTKPVQLLLSGQICQFLMISDLREKKNLQLVKFNLFFYNQNFLHWRKTEFVFLSAVSEFS